MSAVFKREFLAYFKGIIGYVFAAVFIFMIGIFASAVNFAALVANFEYSLYNASFVYLILIPLLTMRSLAEERRQKTDLLLYALPLGSARIVLGKYFAMLAVLALPLSVTALIPLALCLYGTVNLAAAYASILAFFLLGAALIALGMFISSLTENQIVAAVISFFVLLTAYFMGSIHELIPANAESALIAFIVLALAVSLLFYLLTKKALISLGVWAGIMALLGILYLCFPGDVLLNAFRSVISAIGLFDAFYSFINGIFDWTGVVYYLSVSFLFLFFTISSVEKRRWS